MLAKKKNENKMPCYLIEVPNITIFFVVVLHKQKGVKVQVTRVLHIGFNAPVIVKW